MAGVKLIVMYPRPKDIEAFEKVYQKEHVPMAVEKLKGKTKFVATKVIGSPQGTPPLLPDCRSPLSFHGCVAGLRRIRRRQRDAGPCGENFFRRPAGGHGR